MPNSATVPAQRLAQVDGLRGLAAMVVVLFHFTARYDALFGHSRPLGWSVETGLVGVELFFVISGFVIFLTLERCRTPLDFLVSRASRLLPTYWAAVLLASVYFLYEAPAHDAPGWPRVLLNLTMLQELLDVPSLDGVYWSLQVELLFYLLMLLVWTAGWTRRPAILLLLWTGLSLAEAVGRTMGLAGLPLAVTTVLNLSWCGWFTLGIIACIARIPGSVGGALVAAAGLALATILVRQGPAQAAVAVVALALVLAASHRRLRVLESRPLLFLGAVSYPLYLVNEKIGWLVIGSLEAAGYPPAFAVFGAVGAALAAAWLLHRLLERPAMTGIREAWRAARTPGRFDRRRWLTACVILVVAAIGVGPGIRLAKRQIRTDEFQSINGWHPGVLGSVHSCRNLAARGHPLVLVLGQSNAGSHGAPGQSAPPPWVMVDGRCARSGDPLPSTTGRGASLWPAVGSRLEGRRESGAPAVVFAPLAVGDTTIERWTLPGPLHDRLRQTLHAAAASGMPIAAVAWQQGEADAFAGTTASRYRAGLERLLALVRDAGIDAPILVAQSTLCGRADGTLVRAAIATALAESAADGLLPGPDTDRLSGDARHGDGCHFSRRGIERAADLWAAALIGFGVPLLEAPVQAHRAVPP